MKGITYGSYMVKLSYMFPYICIKNIEAILFWMYRKKNEDINTWSNFSKFDSKINNNARFT